MSEGHDFDYADTPKMKLINKETVMESLFDDPDAVFLSSQVQGDFSQQLAPLRVA